MGKRARNGQGSIYETTFVDKRSGKTKTRWQGQVVIPRELGEPKRKTVYGKSYAAVKAKMDALTRQVADGTVSDTAQTVSQYLERWLREKARQVRPRTIELYGHYIESHINPRIGRVRLDKLTPIKVQTMVSEIADEVLQREQERLHTKAVASGAQETAAAKPKNNGVRTANICRTVLYSAMKQAVRWQLVPRNAVEAVDPLKEQTREMTLWTLVEAVRFLHVARTHRLTAAFYLAMSAGLRRGEVLGLRWQDVEGTVLHVRQALTLVGGKAVLAAPKTERGRRRVTISASALKALCAHKKRQEAEAATLGELWPGNDLVFTSEVGTPIHPRNFERAWYGLQTKAEVPKVRFHDLRHLNVSIRRKLGQDAKLIADQIGHTNPAFTMRLYTHLFEEDRQAAAVDLDDLFAVPPEDQNSPEDPD